jgi:hypothetical protein
VEATIAKNGSTTSFIPGLRRNETSGLDGVRFNEPLVWGSPPNSARKHQADLSGAVIIIPTVAVVGITLRAEFDGEAGE